MRRSAKQFQIRGIVQGDYRNEDDTIEAAVDRFTGIVVENGTFVEGGKEPDEATKNVFRNMRTHITNPDLLAHAAASIRQGNLKKAESVAAGAGLLKLLADIKNRPNIIQVRPDEGVPGSEVDFRMTDDAVRNYDAIQPGTFGYIFNLERLREHGDWADGRFVSTPSTPGSDKPYRFACLAKYEDTFAYCIFETRGGRGANGIPQDRRSMWAQVRSEGDLLPSTDDLQDLFYTENFPECEDGSGLVNLGEIRRASFKDYMTIIPEARFTPESVVRLAARLDHGPDRVGWASALIKSAGISEDELKQYQHLGRPAPGQFYISREGQVLVCESQAHHNTPSTSTEADSAMVMDESMSRPDCAEAGRALSASVSSPDSVVTDPTTSHNALAASDHRPELAITSAGEHLAMPELPALTRQSRVEGQTPSAALQKGTSTITGPSAAITTHETREEKTHTGANAMIQPHHRPPVFGQPEFSIKGASTTTASSKNRDNPIELFPKKQRPTKRGYDEVDKEDELIAPTKRQDWRDKPNSFATSDNTGRPRHGGSRRGRSERSKKPPRQRETSEDREKRRMRHEARQSDIQYLDNGPSRRLSDNY